MRLSTVSPKEFQWHDAIVAAFACTLDKTSYTDCERLNRTATMKDRSAANHPGLHRPGRRALLLL